MDYFIKRSTDKMSYVEKKHSRNRNIRKDSIRRDNTELPLKIVSIEAQLKFEDLRWQEGFEGFIFIVC